MSHAACHDRLVFNNHRGGLGRSLSQPGITIAEIHNQGGPMDEHIHDEPHFWLPVRGRYRVECGRRSRSIAPGMLVYTAPGEPHSDRMEGRAGFGMTIVLGNAFVAQQLGGLALPERSTILAASGVVWAAQRMRAELHWLDSASRLVVAGLALDLLGQLCRSGLGRSIESTLADRAAAAVADRFHLADLSVAAVANDLGVHPVHLARGFRKRFGTTPTEFIRAYRCERAAEMLRAGRESLVSIALDCGFGDQSSFTRAFRRSMGVTPGAFRRIVR